MIPVETEDERFESIKGTWSEIFKKFGYQASINKLQAQYPDSKSLYVSFTDISNFSNEFAYELLMEPELHLYAAEKLISEDIPQSRLSDSRRVNVRVEDVPDKDAFVDIAKIRADHVGKLIKVTGIIRKNTEVLPRLQQAVFQCMNAGHIEVIPQARGKVEEPVVCTQCAEDRVQRTRFKLLPNDSEFVDVQKIEIQENPETMQGGTQPQRLTVIVEDDRTGELFPGDRVMITGILVAEQKRQGNVPLTEFYVYLYANNFSRETKEVASLDITPEEEQEIKRLGKSPDIMDLFVQSIAPTIYGYEMIKKALALQMFGGVRKTMKDGTVIRGDIHVLLVGDPGTAKSQLLRYMTEISPRGVMALGKGSSAAGLTAAAVRDDFGEGRWTLEAGVLVLANKGLASIDELDKMSAEDTSAMHEGMEQQSFHRDSRVMTLAGEKAIGELVDGIIQDMPGRITRGTDCELVQLHPGELRVVTTDFNGIYESDADQVSRHTAPDYLLRISTSTGFAVTVTPEHPFFVIDGEIVEKPACDLSQGDLVFILDESTEDPDSGTSLMLVRDTVDSIITVPCLDRFVYDISVSPTRSVMVNEIVCHNSITISKAGIMATLRSQCSVLAAANPILGRYDPDKDLTAQINLSPPLISRFDVIFKVQDRPNTSRDTSLAEHVLEAHLMGETYKAMEHSESGALQLQNELKYVPKIDKNLVRKYVSYARENVIPMLSREATDVIRDYYVQMRNSLKDSVQITPRQLESIIRLSEASAKMRLSTTVTYQDAMVAKGIFEFFMSDVATHDGKIDFDVINTGISRTQRTEMNSLLDIIKELSKSSGAAEISEVYSKCQAQGMPEAKVKDLVSKLLNGGQIFEPSRGKVKPIG